MAALHKQDNQSDSSSDYESSSDDTRIFISFKAHTNIVSPFPFGDDELAIEYFNGYRVSQAAKKLVETACINRPALVSRNEDYPLGPFLNWLKDGYGYMLRTYFSEKKLEDTLVSQMNVVFGSTGFHNLIKQENGKDAKSKEVMTVAWGEPAGDIPVITSFTTGVVANVQEFKQKRTAELENDKLPMLSVLRIPKVDGMQLKQYVITEKQNREFDGDMEKFMALIGINPENRNFLQGIVFLHHELPDVAALQMGSPLVECLQQICKDFPELAVGGAVSPTLLSKGTDDDDVIATGFIILGDPEQVFVSCVTLEGLGMHPENQKLLKDMKNSMLIPKSPHLKSSSFGLLFGSHERGMEMYLEPGYESNYFHLIFPETVLVGGFFPVQFCSDKLRRLTDDSTIGTCTASVYFVVSYVHP